jgi:GDP-L-fucose synthase
MKLLVLGGHGFVGKSFCSLLSGQSENTVISASRRDGLDLTDLNITRKWISDIYPDAVVNCAAHVGSVHYVTAFAANVLTDNIRMTLNLYDAVTSVCPTAKIINPLSNCSYPGDAEIHYEPNWWSGQVHDSVYAYGNYKRFVYVTSKCYQTQYKIRSYNFLIPNIFGPGDSVDPNKTHALNGMIIRMIRANQNKQPSFEIWGTGKPVREWGYIDDMVNIMASGLHTDLDLTYPVNIAQNKGYTIAESAQLIAKATGYPGDLVFNQAYQDGALRKVLDDKQFRTIFPDYKFIDHEEGIRRTVKYYQSIL